MNISEVAKRTGLPASTLRFYEEKGLITSLGREGLQHRFARHLDQLALIDLAQAASGRGRRLCSRLEPDEPRRS
jgi:DNA-binding transcriptional MerR regulator